jgi:hypothetical protein
VHGMCILFKNGCCWVVGVVFAPEDNRCPADASTGRVCADAQDDYCRTSESTAMECMGRFCTAMRAEFGEYYLRKPTYEDYRKQLAINEARGFSGMFGSLDCMHYEWKNCYLAWQDDFGDRDGNESIILEAVADQSLHIWHIFLTSLVRTMTSMSWIGHLWSTTC